MKFKEIKPGMVIHCPTEENAKELLKHLDALGYVWADRDKLLTHANYSSHKEQTCYCIERSMEITYSDMKYFKEEKI